MSEINGVVAGNQTFVVTVGKSASFDHWVTATSLFLSLQAAGKRVTLVSPVLPDLEKQPELKPLFGVNAVSLELGKQNLLVSFPYLPEAVDAVSYAIDEQNNRFLLTIKPKEGKAPLESSDVSFSYAGTVLEVVFLVGVHSWDQLGEVYIKESTLFTSAVRVAFHQFIPELAQMAFCPKQHTCLAELVPSVLAEADLPLTPEVASNLLYGIEKQTDWLSSLRTTAATFTTVATLLQAGAKRQSRPLPVSQAVVAQESTKKSEKIDKPLVATAVKKTAKKTTQKTE